MVVGNTPSILELIRLCPAVSRDVHYELSEQPLEKVLIYNTNACTDFYILKIKLHDG